MVVTPGLRERKKDKLRQALFTSAVRLFEERGSASTSIDDIANEVEVSRKTFFRYYASKEDVVVRDEARKVEIVDFGSPGARFGRERPVGGRPWPPPTRRVLRV